MKKSIFSFLLLFVAFSVFSQDFLDGAFTFSSKKDSYIYLKDGTEVVGTIKDIDRKKGQIEKIKLKVDGKKVEYKPEDVDHMYLMPSGFDKFARGYDNLTDVNYHSKDRAVNLEKIKEGYVLFESVPVQLKKKKMTLLMQLVNPGYDEKIAVYFDPFADETTGFGIGGVNLAGGDKKSYYVKIGDDAAYKLTSKQYKKETDKLFAGCDVARAFKGKLKWSDFSKHVSHYTNECGQE